MDELELQRRIADAQSGDKEALQFIFDSFKPFRHKLAQGFMGKGIDPDDVMQQVDLEFMEAVMAYDGESENSAIKYVTVRTKLNVLNFYRREIRYLDRNVPSGLSDVSQDDDSHSDTYMQMLSDVKLMLHNNNDFDDIDRAIIALRVDEGLTYDEIADRVGMSKSGIQYRLSRLKKLF